MTTVTTHRRLTHPVHLPSDAPRKTAAVLVIVIGIVMVAMTLVNNLFKVGPAFEKLIGDFRPHLTTSAIATSRADINGLGAAGTELQTKVMPALSQQLGMTPTQFSTYLGTTYPAVSAGMTALPQIVPTFNGLITTLDQQRPLFKSADAIPTTSLPATTVPWGLLGAGVLMMAAGALMFFAPRPGAITAVALGAVLIVGSVALSLPQKASDADQLNKNLKPVYTATLVAQAQGALTTVSAMGNQMTTQMLPALATQLKMTPTQLQVFLAAGFPATAAALSNMPAATQRFQSLTTAFDKNLGHYNTLKPVSFAPIIWTMMGAALFTMLLGGFALSKRATKVVTHHI